MSSFIRNQKASWLSFEIAFTLAKQQGSLYVSAARMGYAVIVGGRWLIAIISCGWKLTKEWRALPDSSVWKLTANGGAQCVDSWKDFLVQHTDARRRPAFTLAANCSGERYCNLEAQVGLLRIGKLPRAELTAVRYADMRAADSGNNFHFFLEAAVVKVLLQRRSWYSPGVVFDRDDLWDWV
ncbi:hypothetical protein K7X08_021009 [Anisodus acutangulus]|uniref:Uncharacterized protein n=1 Tax=Anisodus acutangulus TaxID=402998 RepID=A0A9Q1RQI8_9SOLA|nr:hypothetical protein K7X08_021009 [Anisodus acutangulus]